MHEQGPDRSPLVAPLTPYVDPGSTMPELTFRALLLGVVLSALFGMVNAYVGLRVGLTVSASIPSAVLSMAVFRGLVRRGTVLENNVVHTIASSGDSLAAGVVFTVPALIFIGASPDGFRVFLIAASAGVLGILMMIPLRRHLTVTEHGKLPFPEGTACAQVLIAGDRGGAAARPVFLGIAAGGLFQFLMRGLQLWKEQLFFTFTALHKASFGADLNPLFLGVGYLIGLRIALLMCSGGLVAWAVLIPLFDWLAGSVPGQALGISPDVRGMEAAAIWKTHVRFVGAGAVACGGAVSILRVLPMIATSFRQALAVALSTGAGGQTLRTERDLSPRIVLGGTLLIGLALWLVPGLEMSALQTLLAVAFSYFFVVVSARMVGLIGTTSQPVSGMTITALLVSTFALHAAGMEGREGMQASLLVAVVVCIAIALAGDLSQDLKCGALLGATPWVLQLGEIVGVVVSALRMGWVLLLLHDAYTLGSQALPAPQAKLMATLAQGVMEGNLPWALLLLGAGLALAAEAAGIPSLPFAIGLYLPVTTTTGLVCGGLVASFRKPAATADSRTLLASGMIAGDALVGILLAGIVVAGWAEALRWRAPGDGLAESLLTVGAFFALLLFFLRAGRTSERVGAPAAG